MEVNYTKLFADFLSNQGYGTDNQSVPLTNIINLLNKFPNFVFLDYNMSLKDLMINKYRDREIGFENDDEFMHHFEIKTNELLIEYLPKIDTWLTNYKDLFKLTVKTTTNDSQINSNSDQNTYYLNPITTSQINKTITINPNDGTTTVNYSGGNLKVQNVEENDNNGVRKRTTENEKLLQQWGKTRADIMEKILKIRDIYNECIEKFSTLFMGLY